jgi:CubicO group peptidase (beta-lactamase class C family)
MFAEPAMPALSVFTIKSRRSVRYAMPIDELVNQRVLQPPTMLPWGDDGPRERLTPDYKSRAVQGYADDSEPIGQLGVPGTGQMYSTPRDMTAFLAANLSMTAPPAPLRPS